jgi:DNA-binding NtrC family response regulator
LASNASFKNIAVENSIPIPQPAERLKSATILVVDDDPLVIDLLAEYLEGNNYYIIRASSGEDAISKMKTATADVALIDLKMPGIDGLETIERLAAIDTELVMVLMTGFPTIDSSIRAIKLGASDYVLKPFKLEDLSLSISNAVQEHDMRHEMKNLRKRVSELEKRISEKKETIKVNQKVDIISTPEGYSTKLPHLHPAEDDKDDGQR